MGWYFVDKPKEQTVREFFEREFAPAKIADIEVVNNQEAYIAYEGKNGDICASVCLISNQEGPHGEEGYPLWNFGYKDLYEGDRPFYYNCPKRILDILSPTESKDAREWREKCWKVVNGETA